MPYKDPRRQKEYQKEYQKKYYEENREEIKKYREENKEEIKKYYEENQEKRKEANKKYYEKNREGILESRKKYYEENQEKIGESKKKYYEENKDKVKEYKKKYGQENKEKINEYQKERYHTDPCYKLRDIVRKLINQALKGGKGGESFLPYVDWTIPEFREHLESQFEDWMTWDNHGVLHPTEKRWQIDHIKPQSVMLEDVTSMDDPKFRECWALENLRPLEARENILKGNKILHEDLLGT